MKSPIIAKGESLISLLRSVSYETLLTIRKDIGEETFANSELVQIIEDTIDAKKKEKLEALDTISVEPPDFWE